VISNPKQRKPASEFKKAEHRLIQKEENIDRKTEVFDKREKEIAEKERTLSDRDKALARNEEKYNTLLSEQKRNWKKFLP
jgi:ribonuclease Y